MITFDWWDDAIAFARFLADLEAIRYRVKRVGDGWGRRAVVLRDRPRGVLMKGVTPAEKILAVTVALFVAGAWIGIAVFGYLRGAS